MVLQSLLRDALCSLGVEFGVDSQCGGKSLRSCRQGSSNLDFSSKKISLAAEDMRGRMKEWKPKAVVVA